MINSLTKFCHQTSNCINCRNPLCCTCFLLSQLLGSLLSASGKPSGISHSWIFFSILDYRQYFTVFKASSNLVSLPSGGWTWNESVLKFCLPEDSPAEPVGVKTWTCYVHTVFLLKVDTIHKKHYSLKGEEQLQLRKDLHLGLSLHRKQKEVC